MRKRFALLCIGMMLLTVEAFAASTADELWILATGRGPGASGSNWVTDLVVTNSGEDAVEVELSFQGQPAADPFRVTIDAGQSRAFPDVLQSQFGLSSGAGAIHVEAVDDDGEDEATADSVQLSAQARVYQQAAAGTFGQSLEGMADEDAISADGEVATAVIAGVTHDSTYRTNWFAVNVGEDDAGEPVESEVMLEVIRPDGGISASKNYVLAAGSWLFVPLSDAAASMAGGTLRFTMLRGAAIFGASLIDSRTNDPATLEASHAPARDLEFNAEFPSSEGCSFVTRGANAFFRLVPGLKWTLEGEEDGEEIVATVEVLDETRMVDGVRTRVVVESETVGGEILEISRNFFAECSQTGSVFYFGEEVDIYEDGEVVSHAGAWLAGTNGARAGIIMPGEVLAGSRYYQEVAPGVALDRAEHAATGVTMETEVGELEGCVVVRETTPLDPRSVSTKVYCPGVGLVRDDILDLTEVEEP